MSKRSHIFAEVCKDYSLVFRDQRDQTIERKLPTPAPEEILHNLNNFITKWVSYKNSSGARVISKSVEKELKNIECHVRKGCLSHIPPGCGTTRNERLHRELKKTTVTNRIGVDLARTCVERTLFNSNRKRDANLPSIGDMLMNSRKKILLTGVPQSSRALDETNNKVHEINFHAMTNATEDKKINLKTISIENISHIQTRLTSLIDSNDESSTCSDGENVQNSLKPDDENFVILRDALQWWKMSKIVEEKTGPKLFNFKKIVTYVRPLKTKALMENETVAGEKTKSDRKRLTELASTWGFDIVEVTGDGNCLFTAVAMQLQQMMSLNAHNESLLMSHLAEQMGIDTSTSINDIGSILRSKVVQELKGERVDFYQSFLPSDVNFFSEADRFIQSGTFSGPLGDLIPLAIANVQVQLHQRIRYLYERMQLLWMVPRRDKRCRTPRKRSQKYRHTVKAKRSRLSLEENDEKIKDPGLNELEFFVMHAIIQHANSKKDVKNDNSHFCDMFSKIVKVVNSFAFLMVLPIFHHSLQVLYDEKRKYDKLRKR